MTARGRLALLYTGLVLAAGLVLIALTFLLVRRDRPRVVVAFGTGRPVIDPDALSASLDDMHAQTMADFLTQSAIALGIVVVVAAALGWLVAGRVIQSSVAERDRLLDSQRMFVANAAHELRTPLTTMRAAIDVTLDGRPTTSELLAMAGDISDAVDHSQRTLDGLLILARSQTGLVKQREVDLAALVTSALEGVQDLELRTDLRPAVIRGEPVLLERMVNNLVDNAVRYNVAGGHIAVRTGQAFLRIVNSGQVVDPAEVDSLFEPFVRGSRRVRGTGLGLSIVRAVVTAHGGTLSYAACPSGGLDITVQLAPGGNTGKPAGAPSASS
ncbi:sensor histidine kinase [Kibdelosporangium aridum]|uniref:sensor histidine kinase n=1 Tax=Kibdelosporangium aridum TaxID=2030 RepID=UPI0005243A13